MGIPLLPLDELAMGFNVWATLPLLPLPFASAALSLSFALPNRNSVRLATVEVLAVLVWLWVRASGESLVDTGGA
ncbi:hypothetical protein B0H19DRAFT_1097831 [Mycena capillaripes]|nr:hypothetical protein B0H19DRAFT_1097831 [Mycena capillaripes]